MKRPTINLSVLSVGFLFLAQSAVAQTETQTFDNQASAEGAGWVVNDEGKNPERGCADCFTDLGWKDSNLAGGNSAGEGGGALHRSGGLPIGFYGDLSIGILSLDTKIEASGKIILVNTNFDGNAHLGFFDGARLAEDPLNYGAELGITLTEPGGGVDPNFRWGTRIRANDGTDAGGGGFAQGLLNDEPLDFFLSYSPIEGDFGVLTVEIGGDAPAELVLTQDLRESAASFTAFGIYTGPFIGSARADSMEILIDDVTYSSLGTSITPGDFNSDGNINQADFLILASNFNTKGTEFADGDIDLNGVVNGADFQAFRAIFNSPPAGVAAAAVPEPGSCLLAVMGLLGVVLARRQRRT